MSIHFTNKWVENAVEKILGKTQIEEVDLEKIKYLAIGETFDNDFCVQMSLETPPKPFVNSDGGDEWLFACFKRGDAPDLLRKYEDEYEGKKTISLSTTDCEPDSKWSEYIDSDKPQELWENFQKSVCGENYYEQYEDDEQFDNWYNGVADSLWQDIELFLGLEVLRVQGLKMPNFKSFSKMPKLRVLELVGTYFSSDESMDRLYDLEQLCCWTD